MNESGLVCEWLGDFFLPSFSTQVRHQWNKTLYDFLLTRDNGTQTFLNKLLYADLLKYFTLCNQIESNIVYLIWLFNLFKPLLLTIFITLFLLPTTIFVFIYASSMFIFLSKHWNKLKVSFLVWYSLAVITVYNCYA